MHGKGPGASYITGYYSLAPKTLQQPRYSEMGVAAATGFFPCIVFTFSLFYLPQGINAEELLDEFLELRRECLKQSCIKGRAESARSLGGVLTYYIHRMLNGVFYLTLYSLSNW